LRAPLVDKTGNPNHSCNSYLNVSSLASTMVFQASVTEKRSSMAGWRPFALSRRLSLKYWRVYEGSEKVFGEGMISCCVMCIGRHILLLAHLFHNVTRVVNNRIHRVVAPISTLSLLRRLRHRRGLLLKYVVIKQPSNLEESATDQGKDGKEGDLMGIPAWAGGWRGGGGGGCGWFWRTGCWSIR
jgi:hypothetical protein